MNCSHAFFFAEAILAFVSGFLNHVSKAAILDRVILVQCKMVVLTIVTQKNRETIYFDQPFPKVHFMKLLSCSLYNSWDTLKNEGSAGLDDRNLNPSGKISKLAAGHYDLDTLAKKIRNLLSSIPYDGLVAEANTPLGQLMINNFGESQISLDHHLAKLFGTGQIFPKMAIIKRILKDPSQPSPFSMTSKLLL